MQNSAPVISSPGSNVSRNQPAHNQNNQISTEQPKIQQQEDIHYHVDTKENQESVKKDMPSTEGIKSNI